MDTIEERAAQTSTRVIEMCALQQFGEDGCGCTHEIERALKAQQEIDIQHACEWLSNKLQQDSLGETYLYFKYCDEQDFINDFIQAMKGE